MDQKVPNMQAMGLHQMHIANTKAEHFAAGALIQYCEEPRCQPWLTYLAYTEEIFGVEPFES